MEEIQNGMKMAKADLPSDIVEIVKNLDTDGNGNIDYTERGPRRSLSEVYESSIGAHLYTG